MLDTANPLVGIVHRPQNAHFNVSSKMLQFYKPDILQEWMDYLSGTCMALFNPVRCVFSRTDEYCYWDVSYQHLIILVMMTSLSFSVKNWHRLLMEEAADKLKNYGFYKVRVCWKVLLGCESQ